MDNQQEIATPDELNNIRKVRSHTVKFGTTRWLTYTAVFAALAIVMKFIGQYLTLTDSFKITFIYAIWLMGAAVTGPIGGGTICFVSDVLGAIVVPKGPINPFLVMGNVVYGVVAALVFRYTPVKNNAVKFIAAGAVCTLLCTCTLNSLALYYYYGYYTTLTFWQYFIGARAMQLVVAVINIAVTVALIPFLKQIKILPPLKKIPKTEERSCPISR